MAGSRDIVFLLGAGASAEAGIPTSAEMIGRIESQLESPTTQWKLHAPLYNHVKSAIHYAAGLKGQFSDVPYNIETLVNALYELERNEDHPLYPFVAYWNPRLVSLAGTNFEQVRALRALILSELKRWMSPEDGAKSAYYQGLCQVQRTLTYPLHVFSLNYDLLVESLASSDFKVESGFEGFGPAHVWDWERFEESDTAPAPMPDLFLYKLHGSINWKRDEGTKNLYRVEQVTNVEPDSMEVIFGRDFKLDAADPYLFYAYEFRKFSLLTKLIVVIGYGFGDSHINKMLTQALRDNTDRRMVVVARCVDAAAQQQRQVMVSQRLELKSDAQRARIIIKTGSAKEFLEQPELASSLLDLIPLNPDAPF